MDIRTLSTFCMASILAACTAACSNAVEQPQADDGAERIGCALAGAGNVSRDCLVERSTADGAALFVVRHPDGSFRRFEQLDGGRGLQVADGARNAKQELVDGALHVTVDGDRYVFPARIDEPQIASDD